MAIIQINARRAFRVIKILKTIYSRKIPVYVDDIGPADFTGYASVKCTDGRIRSLRYPVKGQFVCNWIDVPEVIPCQNKDAWVVKTSDGNSFEVTNQEINRKLKEAKDAKDEETKASKAKTKAMRKSI